MKFMMTFTWTPDAETRAEAIARFQNKGGVPPDGVTLLGRWTSADLSCGFGLFETDDPRKLAQFAYAWNDLMQLRLAPVLDDEALASVFAAV
ncbi:hypothetical protein AWB82_02748 [Caballeronia glebae]|uniref:DUF3303 domain-containing protein n=1 Tax=Caballeronia glebae TaxID=1777143 RepID=A0A158AQ58_9BURK|nr:DUF3303 family protein [Caballeronia glebae]SAK59883.1 hypothetical protein AWB82_02748 [Caballeronia glebae]